MSQQLSGAQKYITTVSSTGYCCHFSLFVSVLTVQSHQKSSTSLRDTSVHVLNKNIKCFWIASILGRASRDKHCWLMSSLLYSWVSNNPPYLFNMPLSFSVSLYPLCWPFCIHTALWKLKVTVLSRVIMAAIWSFKSPLREWLGDIYFPGLFHLSH